MISSTVKLPFTSPDLFGRARELTALDAAWDNPRIGVVMLVAFGGVAKTALVNVWLNRLEAEDWRGAERVLGWSFYSQGASEGRQASADPFIDAALRWFGDPDPTHGSPWEKGERLAALVRAQRTLLVLDGLEPLQYPPGAALGGRLKDPALESLLRELARDNPGLCVVTTRLAVSDLSDFAQESVETIGLENLALEDGARYLARLGVRGTPEELRQAAQELDGHALALTLLGTYLVAAHGGDVRRRDLVPRLTSAHARRMMEAYERWFEGKPELDILRLMGLFDRPADPGALGRLRRWPPIRDLTELVEGLGDCEWDAALDNLRQARLLDPADPHQPGTLDCHPLVREHFGEKLEAAAPEAWRKAHRRLYRYYRSAAKYLPDTIEEMAPLLAAVAHGCQAGRHQEVLEDLYWRRIAREDEHFITSKLGAYGADLTALACFFDPPWEKPVAGLSEPDKGFMLNDAAVDLRALGRLAEAVQPLETSLKTYTASEDWRNAAIAAGNVSELLLALGAVDRAIVHAEQSVELADRSGDSFARMLGRTTLADALHQGGRLAEAQRLFEEAEQVQQERRPDYPLLCSFAGFRYCDLLLGEGRCDEVRDRAEKTLGWSRSHNVLLDLGLDQVSLGRATQAADYLERAVSGLRQAGSQHHLPLGLLARASLYRLRQDSVRAQRDLDEALLLATRGSMRLHEADCHLEQARLSLATGDRERARSSVAAARALIGQTGYHRRDAELGSLLDATEENETNT